MRDDRYPCFIFQRASRHGARSFSVYFPSARGFLRRAPPASSGSFSYVTCIKATKACLDELISIERDIPPSFARHLGVYRCTPPTCDTTRTISRILHSDSKRTYGLGLRWIFKSIGIFLHSRPHMGDHFMPHDTFSGHGWISLTGSGYRLLLLGVGYGSPLYSHPHRRIPGRENRQPCLDTTTVTPRNDEASRLPFETSSPWLSLHGSEQPVSD